MNSLLENAKGDYFTWQFDDDPCLPNYFREIVTAINKYDNPECVFTNFETLYGKQKIEINYNNKNNTKCFSGKDFLTNYLSNNIQALGCCGFYRTDYLQKIGGVKKLYSGKMALYSEYLLLVRQGLADKVVFIDKRLVTTRYHTDSWTYNNDNYELFWEAGINYIKECIIILLDDKLSQNFRNNLKSVLKSVISSVAVKAWESKKLRAFADMKIYCNQIKKELCSINNMRIRKEAIQELENASRYNYIFFLKSIIKRVIPLWIYSFYQSKIGSIRKLSKQNF